MMSYLHIMAGYQLPKKGVFLKSLVSMYLTQLWVYIDLQQWGEDWCLRLFIVWAFGSFKSAVTKLTYVIESEWRSVVRA